MGWREASTLIVAARLANAGLKSSIGSVLKNNNPAKDPVQSIDQSTDYNILVTKRSHRASFMASSYVFPGGVVDPSDYSSAWWPLFDKLGFQKNSLITSMRSRVTGPRPPMITHPFSSTHDDKLIPDIALRITAIREAFEETGLLILVDPLASTGENSNQELYDDNPSELLDWRSKVRKNGDAFIEMCDHLKKIPDVWSLYEWWNWATPKVEGPKRFDTMFYIHCSNHQPRVVIDNAEVTQFKWKSPKELLREFADKKIILPPPQAFELARIANFNQLSDLRQFSVDREKQGVERWLPVVLKKHNGREIFLPGDILYPEDPEADLELIDGQDENDLMNTRKPINRFKSADNVFSYISNQRNFGHLPPIFNP